jgi:hypothetical protein
MEENRINKLLVLWTTKDKEVAKNMVFMYTLNSKLKGWWENVWLLVWGPSAQLLAEDKEMQEYVKKMMDAGVNVIACKACAENYGVVEELEQQGIKVFYVGQWFTGYLKDGGTTLTV